MIYSKILYELILQKKFTESIFFLIFYNFRITISFPKDIFSDLNISNSWLSVLSLFCNNLSERSSSLSCCTYNKCSKISIVYFHENNKLLLYWINREMIEVDNHVDLNYVVIDSNSNYETKKVFEYKIIIYPHWFHSGHSIAVCSLLYLKLECGAQIYGKGV